MAAVWRDVAVTDDSLIHAVSVLRRALGDDPVQPSFIETIPRRGYRFIGRSSRTEMPSRRASTLLEARSASETDVGRASPTRPGAAVAVAVLVVAALRRAYGPARRASEQLSFASSRRPARNGDRVRRRGVAARRHLAFVAREQQSGRTALWIALVECARAAAASRHGRRLEAVLLARRRQLAFFANGRLLATDVAGDTRARSRQFRRPAGGSWGATTDPLRRLDDRAIFGSGDGRTGVATDATGSRGARCRACLAAVPAGRPALPLPGHQPGQHAGRAYTSARRRARQRRDCSTRRLPRRTPLPAFCSTCSTTC